ncbi:PTS sugar transporter subunit IIA [Enterovibrio norvegicus]|uniref:PTS sugar transporter subunit IIA n=1 Tax=Enterovibrio norvegicus TaxID=188144 RepID=UPI000C81D358|nr:PTS sugar transporter subunit IIA [Enterovibrio norvegicus]PML77399.1 PTS nitrogen regulatory IIA subunit [Enterovibrio norvegicus]
MTMPTISRRITFLIGEEGLPAWKLNRLKTLAGLFRSVTVFCNLSQRNAANAEQPIRILSLSSRPNDLCQLLIEGNDAELAAMVLTDFAAEHGVLVCGGKRAKATPTSTFISLPFSYQVYQAPQSNLDKHALLAEFALRVAQNEHHEESTQEALFNALYARENVSSTCMGNGIALPHVMTPLVSQIHIFTASTAQPLDWLSKRGEVTRVIGVMLPKPPVREHIVAFSTFSQQLLDKTFCRYLEENTSLDIVETIVLHSLGTALTNH